MYNMRDCYQSNWVSKVIRDCIGFALTCSVIGLENSHHLLNQSDANLNQSRLGHSRFPALEATYKYLLWVLLLACDVNLCWDWLLWLLWFWFYDTQSKSTLCYNLGITAKIAVIVMTVEPHVSGHPWGQKKCPLRGGGVRLWEVKNVGFMCVWGHKKCPLKKGVPGLYLVFVEFEKAFDSVYRNVIQ